MLTRQATHTKQTKETGRTLHMIGNAHLDPVWLWQWPDGFQEAKATFRSALDRMNESEAFVFTSSSAALYEWVEENEPALFAEIQRRVAEGRWQIVGGWWIQPDCNLPGGESFVRQGLYGQRYFKEKLGVTATVGYNVDSFGHSAMLPQILAKTGMDSYVFMRPEPHEKDLPARLFWWESDDGSRVLAFRIPYAYTAGATTTGLETQIHRCAAELTDGAGESMCFYGVGNHGGGPTRENLVRIAEMNEDPSLPRLVYSSPRDYFDRFARLDGAVPTVHDELQRHASGCYAAHSGVKRWNRLAENRLLTAEKWSAIACQILGRAYPRDELTRAWKNVLFNQFHDILAGTSIEPAYEDARDTYGEAMAIANRCLHHALQALSWQIDIPHEPGTTPLVVFNPHAWPAKVAIEHEFGRLPEGGGLLDDQHRPVPLQIVQSRATVSGGRNRLCFVADLPPMGWRVYHVAPQAAITAAGAHAVKATDHSLENGRFRLEIDPATGFIHRLFDKRHGVEVLRDGAARPVVIADRSDTWGHGVSVYDDVIGQFTATKIELVEQGPVKAVLRVESAYGDSTLVQNIAMYADLEPIEVRVSVDWREQHKMLKLLFPVNVEDGVATYEIPYGTIQRSQNGEEEPGQTWIDLTGEVPGTDERYGLSVLNDGKYSFNVRDNAIGLTVLRSPIYAHHDPYEPPADRRYAYVDHGFQQFTYALLPHADDWPDACTVRHAAELNQPPIAMAETYHDGPLAQRATFAEVDRENVAVSALKQAEEGDDLIVRCHETAGQAIQARIALPAWQRKIVADFAPWEIKTFRVPRDTAMPVRETDLIEWS